MDDAVPAGEPSTSHANDRHDVEVKLLSHSDDQSGILQFPDTSISITIAELKEMILEKLNPGTNAETLYLLFMGRRIPNHAILRDVVSRVVGTTSRTCY
jgi:hypothetical protein